MKKFSIILFSLIFLYVMISCSQKEVVDLIVKNATIYTVDSNFSKVESFVVVDGKIIETSTVAAIDKKYTSKNVVDATGKYIYPGFIDAHSHFNGYGVNLMQYADLRGTESKEEIYEILKSHYEKFGGDWILGRSWDQNDWSIKEFPDKTGLDKMFPNVPVYLIRVDGHAGWCNSKAFEIGKITGDLKVTGGDILLKNGKLTGVLIDNAMGLVSQHIPDISREQQEKGLLAAQKNCFAVGLTSVADCGVGKNTVLLMNEMQKSGSLKMRINAMLNPSKSNIEHFVKNGKYKTERLTVNTIKLFADGALGSRGALMIEEYTDDPGNRGLQIADQAYYDNICQLAYDNNYAVATHCIGDSANRLMLNTYGKFLKSKNDRRWRIEHSQIINLNDFGKFAQFSIIPSIQATHCTSDMYWAEDRVGEERIKGAYSYQTLLNQLGWLPNGTDFPVENIEPLFTFYASVFRVDQKGWPEGGWRMEEGLTREQTLRSMTIWAAKASFDEHEKGSLEVGKWADFIILDTDLMYASQKEIFDCKVLSTWSSGLKVFEL
ncbi:MAG: amidohydrolase family protein [Draconibacterium sp.]|nr:amidohydrolase family protein [Draconibacterium sp.]